MNLELLSFFSYWKSHAYKSMRTHAVSAAVAIHIIVISQRSDTTRGTTEKTMIVFDAILPLVNISCF